MRDEKLLKKAISLMPKLIYKNVSPVGTDYQTKQLKKGDSIVLDFGDHQVGRLAFDLKAKGSHPDAPAYLRLHFAEREIELTENPKEYNGWVCASWIEEEYIHVDVIPSTVKLPRRYAFRYVKIEVLDISDKYTIYFDNVVCTSESSADDTKLVALNTTNELHKSLDKVAIKTLHDCMQLVFEDGPKRDRRLWIGDLRMQALANYETYRNYELVKECLYLFGALTNDEGRVGACIFLEPEPEVDDTFMFDYSLFFINILLDYYRKTADLQAVKDLWHVCKRQIELAMKNLDDNYVVADSDKLGWCFVDWNLGLNKQGSAQGILLYALEAAIELAQIVEDVLVEEEYAQYYLQIKTSANKVLFDSEKGVYISGSDRQISFASQVWMILGGAIEGNKAVKLLERTKAMDDAAMMVTPYMYHNYIEALIMIGEKDLALKEMESYWGGMLDEGADTFWELYNPKNPNESPYGGTIVNSYCHAWSCGPTYFLRKYFCN